MKTPVVILILVSAILLSAFAYYNKMSRQTDDIDNITSALSGAHTFIKPGSSIAFSGEEDKVELFVWTRYILAPAIITIPHKTTSDTLLSIKYLSDTVMTTDNIIWQNSDRLYRYTLSTLP